MRIELSEHSAADLAEYARVPIAFEVRCVLQVAAPANGLGGLVLSERSLEIPYLKDYDAIEGEGPLQWPNRFDLSSWGLFAARAQGQRLGSAAVAFPAAKLGIFEGRSDLAVLWDIRVAPEVRGKGVGAALLRAAEAWASPKGCRCIEVETQNINLPACRFYARQGFVLGAIQRFAYPEFPDEVRLLWYKDLTSSGASD